jgi:hypothetical protein
MLFHTQHIRRWTIMLWSLVWSMATSTWWCSILYWMRRRWYRMPLHYPVRFISYRDWSFHYFDIVNDGLHFGINRLLRHYNVGEFFTCYRAVHRLQILPTSRTSAISGHFPPSCIAGSVLRNGHAEILRQRPPHELLR